MTVTETGNSLVFDDSDMNPSACRELWNAAILEQFRLASQPGPNFANTPLDIMRARDWFGTRDFHMTCALAGLDGEWVLMGFLRKMTALQVMA